jgi:ABC-type oligopeptide transport system substrate-binding subunit
MRFGLLVAVLLAALGADSPTASSDRLVAHKSGGSLEARLSGDLDYVDPGLDYLAAGWEIQYAVGCKLLNYPDQSGPAGGELQPEAATGFPRISNGGRTYTFTIRGGYRFANGEKVTAASFAAAYNRDANARFQSPAQFFLTDLVGARDVFRGRRQTISGITVRANSIRFTLTHPAPDFLSRVAMPFFQAIPKNMWNAVAPTGVTSFASCGPYYVSSWVPAHTLVLKRNQYYYGPRPQNLDQIKYAIGAPALTNEQDVLQGAADYTADGIPAGDAAALAKRFDVNRTQFWVQTSLGVAYLALNHDRALFKNNPGLAKAVNFAIDRRALLDQAGFGAGRATDHILPPGVPGARKCSCYPLAGPDFRKAAALAKGNTRGGNAVLWVSDKPGDLVQAKIIQYDLSRIGLRVSVQSFARPVQIEKEGTRGAAFDIVMDGWMADYNDPFDFINTLLSAGAIRAYNSNNIAYFQSARYDRQMAQAARLRGAARYSAYGSLDIQMMRDDPPWAPLYNFNRRILISKRTGCLIFNPVYQVDLAALCLQ